MRSNRTARDHRLAPATTRGLLAKDPAWSRGLNLLQRLDGVKVVPHGVVDNLTGAGVVTGVQGYVGAALGMTAFAGDMLRDSELGDPAPAITLTLSNLPPHNAINISFLLAVIDSWDGQPFNSGGPDYFNVQLTEAPSSMRRLPTMVGSILRWWGQLAL